MKMVSSRPLIELKLPVVPLLLKEPMFMETRDRLTDRMIALAIIGGKSPCRGPRKMFSMSLKRLFRTDVFTTVLQVATLLFTAVVMSPNMFRKFESAFTTTGIPLFMGLRLHSRISAMTFVMNTVPRSRSIRRLVNLLFVRL